MTRPDAGGYLVIRKPWPSMLRTIWGDNERYLGTYWEKFQNRYYVAGDSAHRDEDGYFWIMGRIDDVLKVAGHRLGTMEIESALVAHPRVAEAAVVGRPHDIKGESVFAFVVLPRRAAHRRHAARWSRSCATGWASSSAPIAKPDDIRFADNLPKTRSGKIMRRLLRAIARGEEITQDISTLENPAIVEQLRGAILAPAEGEGEGEEGEGEGKGEEATADAAARGEESGGAKEDRNEAPARGEAESGSKTHAAAQIAAPGAAREMTRGRRAASAVRQRRITRGACAAVRRCAR